MATVTLTIYEALAKRKILEARVEKTRAYRLVDVKKKYSDENKDGVNIDEIRKRIQAGYDESIAVMNNYRAIQAAINESNAKTTVNVNGKTYTVANAIARHRNLDKEERMYRSMLEDYREAERAVQQLNEKQLSPDAISRFVQSTAGTKTNDELVRNLTQQYKERYEVELFDPLNTKELAEKMLEDIKKFREEIHFTLTQSNVTTTITVELDD